MSDEHFGGRGGGGALIEYRYGNWNEVERKTVTIFQSSYTFEQNFSLMKSNGPGVA